jgi:hypothetical protein
MLTSIIRLSIARLKEINFINLNLILILFNPKFIKLKKWGYLSIKKSSLLEIGPSTRIKLISNICLIIEKIFNLKRTGAKTKFFLSSRRF